MSIVDVTNRMERQVFPTLDGFRRDHVARYEWVADRFRGGDSRIVDAACGVGYGSKILADRGNCKVHAYDRSPVAIEYAKQHYNHNDAIKYIPASVYRVDLPDIYDAVVCFEAIEHLTKPEIALRKFRRMAPTLIVSSPNETMFPFRGYAHHVKHYTKDQLEELLNENGYRVTEWWGQEHTDSEVEKDAMGRTIIAVAERTDEEIAPLAEEEQDIKESLLLDGKVPESVAIVAMGNSRNDYFFHSVHMGSRHRIADEIWAINAMGGTIQHDRLFHMDDMKIQEARAEHAPDSSIGPMIKSIRTNNAPVYTSRVYEDYPATVDYPLEWVVNELGTVYFNSTVAYAFAMALALGVKKIFLYGCDFTYAEDRHKGEMGRACLEFWIGVARAKEVEVVVPESSTLLDANVDVRQRLYGYETEWVTWDVENGKFRVAKTQKRPEDIPTAEEMNYRYSHNPDIESKALMNGGSHEGR